MDAERSTAIRGWKARGTAILLMVFYALLAIGSLSLVIFGGVLQSWVASIIGWSGALLPEGRDAVARVEEKLQAWKRCTLVDQRLHADGQEP